jgi:hypothetical protein
VADGTQLVSRQWPLAGSLLSLLLCAACSPASDESQPEVLGEGKVGLPEAITSLDWLRQECSGLADATAVTYYGGYVGWEVEEYERIDVPGPHDFWRDLVVTLPEGSAAALVDEYGMEVATTQPDVISLLEPELPPGPLYTSQAFDSGVCAPYLRVDGWISVVHDQAVLTVYEP